MELSKKAAYIKGLIEGLKLEENSDQGKVLKAMSDLLEEMAAHIEEMTLAFNEAVDTIDDINSDLTDLEREVYGEDFEDDFDEDGEFDEGEAIYECVCPTCGDTIRLSDTLLADGEITCPGCGEVLEFDYSEDDIEDPDSSDN